VIPLKDDIPYRRFPVVTVAVIAGGVIASLLLDGAPSVWVLLVSGVFLWLFGPTIEDAMGPVRYAVFLAAGAAVSAALDPEAGVAAAGGVAAVLTGHALLYPRAHVVTLGFLPGMMSVFQLPALAVLATWLPLQALAGGLDPAPLAGLAVGAALVHLLARDPQSEYQRPGGVPAY
jgi:membrane associated rhomboid family serine protease